MASPTALTPPAVARLKADWELLHVLYHRNKNQHRSGKWWQWLATLRRHLAKLLAEAEDAAAGDESKADVMAKRMEFMTAVVVPKCYVAFNNVIQGGRFAPLGLVLLGVLARVAGHVGLEARPAPEPASASNEVDVPPHIHNELGVVVSRETYAPLADSDDSGKHDDSTLPRTIRTEIPSPVLAPADGKSGCGKETDPATQETANSIVERKIKTKRKSTPAQEAGPEPEKKKKKRKKGSEIDDLFSRLL